MKILLTFLATQVVIFHCFSQNDGNWKVPFHGNHIKLARKEKKCLRIKSLKLDSSSKEQQIKAGLAFNDFTYIIIDGNQNGFGYDIITQGRLIIHQPHIPSIVGNKGFSTKEDAQKTAQLVIYKLNKNIMPPSVSKKELDSLQLKY